MDEDIDLLKDKLHERSCDYLNDMASHIYENYDKNGVLTHAQMISVWVHLTQNLIQMELSMHAYLKKESSKIASIDALIELIRDVTAQTIQELEMSKKPLH